MIQQLLGGAGATESVSVVDCPYNFNNPELCLPQLPILPKYPPVTLLTPQYHPLTLLTRQYHPVTLPTPQYHLLTPFLQDKKESAELEQSVAALQQLHILAQLSGGSEDVMKQLQALTQVLHVSTFPISVC